MLDRAVFPDGCSPEKLAQRLGTLLDLTSISATFDAEVAAVIVNEQLETCLDLIFSHPIWSRFRTGDAADLAVAYLIETHHYLAAAPSRMAPGPAYSSLDRPALPSLAEHVVEEAGHDRFFAVALAELGCDVNAVRMARPLPATVEWIHLMRSVSSRGPIAAALCSGVLESSAVDRSNVRMWHELLIQRGLLPEQAVRAILGHVDVDEQLGHGENWREVLRLEAPIATRELADALNAAATVAEMIVRWLDALCEGDSALVVGLLQRVGAVPGRAVDPTFAGLPVWPAPVLARISHHGGSHDGATRVLAAAFHFDGRLSADVPELEAARTLQALAMGDTSASDAAALERLAKSWLTAIEGHELWAQMLESSSSALASGWLLENYWYLRSSPQHTGAAIAACSERVVRDVLVAHLAEEAMHDAILSQGLNAAGLPLSPADTRPLATTTAFVGALRDIGLTDWRAYCLSIAFLQFSLGTDQRQEGFYSELVRRVPSAAPLVRAMHRHDQIDSGLGHSNQMQTLLQALARIPGGVPVASIERAAVIPQLAWGFLDGIAHHYQGELTLVQRIAWR